jgi:hypothetical protein
MKEQEQSLNSKNIWYHKYLQYNFSSLQLVRSAESNGILYHMDRLLLHSLHSRAANKV